MMIFGFLGLSEVSLKATANLVSRWEIGVAAKKALLERNSQNPAPWCSIESGPENRNISTQEHTTQNKPLLLKNPSGAQNENC